MALFSYHGPDHAYDVVICGGGLAGATLARQLKLHYPEITVLVLDRQTYPVPTAAHKVGESTVEIAGFYFAEALQLRELMDRIHLPKLGLRYFWHGRRPFAERPELGLSHYLRCPSYQIDRGLLENDLFRLNREAGVDIREDVRVGDIHLAADPEWHTVTWLDRDDREHRARARWAVDAMGRRRLLQTKLGLGKEVADKFNAVWFRVRGRLDLEDFVADEVTSWHDRVPGRQRYHSTNHMMGPGYWIWLIPLGSGNTSVGIVTAASLHDYAAMDTLDKALSWLEANDPTVYAAVRGCEFMDFLGFRSFNYSTRRLYSRDRWACVGEAAAFADPFYSPGSNMIGFENTALTRMIGEDHAGALTAERVEFLNDWMISQNDWLDYNVHTSYYYFGEPLVMSLSYLWDTVVGWGIATPQMFNSIYLDPEATRLVRGELARFYALAIRVKELFIAWGARTRRSMTFDFIDYYAIPFVREIYDRCLHPGKTRDELVADHRFVMTRLEEFAQVIFAIAIADALPDHARRLPDPLWLDAWAIGLDPTRWEDDGLFRPASPARPLEPMLSQIRNLYRPDRPTAPPPAVSLAIDLDV